MAVVAAVMVVVVDVRDHLTIICYILLCLRARLPARECLPIWLSSLGRLLEHGLFAVRAK